MKNHKLLSGLMLLTVISVARATFYSYEMNSGSVLIPDGNIVGITSSTNVSGIPHPGGDGTTPVITDVNVRLNITGGYNGDLYGYLQLHDELNQTVLTVLLNRVGTGSGSEPQITFGYSTSGMNVKLDDAAAASIHGVANPTSGASYQPDSGAGSLADFNDYLANGTWTMFLADRSGGGGQSTLVSWGLDINVVPEPTTWALIIFGAGVAGQFLIRRFRRQQA